MMTVRCPNCAATYQLDASKLASGGRKLKCAQCQTVWIATAEPEVVPVVEVPVEEIPEVKKPVGIEDAAAEEAAVQVEDEPVEGFGDVLPSEEEIIQRTPGVDALIRVGGWRQYVRGDNIWRSGAVVLILMGVLAGAGVVFSRMGAHEVETVKVKGHAPVDAEAAHKDAVVQPPKGVVLHHVRGEVSEIEGGQGGVALTVRGLLTNTTSATVVVPPLRLELLGADGKVADMWPVSNVSGTLAPAAEQAWTVSLTAPDMSSVKGWRVVFVSE